MRGRLSPLSSSHKASSYSRKCHNVFRVFAVLAHQWSRLEIKCHCSKQRNTTYQHHCTSIFWLCVVWTPTLLSKSWFCLLVLTALTPKDDFEKITICRRQWTAGSSDSYPKNSSRKRLFWKFPEAIRKWLKVCYHILFWATKTLVVVRPNRIIL